MNIDLLNHAIKFDNIPEGKLYLNKCMSLNLNPKYLGQFFKYTGNTIRDNFTNITFQLIGLTSKEFSEKLLYLKTNNKLSYLKYYNNFMPIYYIVFQIYENNIQIYKRFICSIDTFNLEFEKI